MLLLLDAVLVLVSQVDGPVQIVGIGGGGDVAGLGSNVGSIVFGGTIAVVGVYHGAIVL